MASPTFAAPLVERRKPPQRNQPTDYGWTLYLIIITLLMVAGFVFARDNLYKPGDNVGYNLGLTGGIMMLTLLLYPLRKRAGFMKNWIILPWWFKWHMVFGVLGPAIIVLHSTYHIGSINAGVALTCTMLISGSGIFGRFFYTKVHYGLYGRQTSYQQLQEELEGVGDMKSIFSFAPHLQKKLIKFRDRAIGSSKLGSVRIWPFLTLGIRAKFLGRSLARELEAAMYADATSRNWNRIQMKRLDELFVQNRAFINTYLETLQQVAQFGVYERLFSVWHVFHVPLTYMLVFSAIWHVIAVHMY